MLVAQLVKHFAQNTMPSTNRLSVIKSYLNGQLLLLLLLLLFGSLISQLWLTAVPHQYQFFARVPRPGTCDQPSWLTEACALLLLVYHRQQQLSSIEAAKTGAEAKAAEALETVLAAVPRHRQDLVLIEALDRALAGAKKAAAKKFVDSSAAASDIATQIAALRQVLQPQVSTPPLIVSQQAVLSLSAALEP